jgi:hypothetical protein
MVIAAFSGIYISFSDLNRSIVNKKVHKEKKDATIGAKT